MSPAHEPAYAEDGKPKLRYQLYQEEKAKGGIALSMFGGSTNVAPDSPPDLRPAVRRRRRHHPVVPAAGRPDARPRHGDDGPADPPRPADGLGRRRLAADDLGLVGPRARPSERSRRRWRSPTSGASSPPSPRRRGAARRAGSTDSRSRRTATSSTSSGRRSSTGVAIATAARSRTGCASRSRSSRRSGRAVGDDFIVGIRMTGGEDVAGGLTEADGIEIASTLARTGTIDFINIIKGSIATDEAISHVIPGMGTPLGPALEFAGRFRERVNLPIFHANRIADVATARYAISEGLVDMVGMMRAHMADPHIVRKLEAGEADRIRACVGASYCINRLYLGLDSLCIQNPATGREETIPQLIAPSAGPRRRVVVVGRRTGRAGGGAGGRRTWARGRPARGRARQPGGQVRLAAQATPRRADLMGIVDWLAAECRLLGVDLRCDMVADGARSSARSSPTSSSSRPAAGRAPPRLAEGEDLVVSTWDIIGGSATPTTRRGAPVRRPRHRRRRCRVPSGWSPPDPRSRSCRPTGTSARRSPARPTRPISKTFYEQGVRMTPDHRLVAVRRSADGRLEVDLWNDYTAGRCSRIVDQVVVEHGSLPNDEVYLALVDGSIQRRGAGPRRVHRRPAAGARRQPGPARTSCSASATPSRAGTSMPRSTTGGGSRWRSRGRAARLSGARRSRSSAPRTAARRRRRRRTRSARGRATGECP